MSVNFKKVESAADIKLVSDMAGHIWTEHYTPIIGANQVSYMLSRFQNEAAITAQIENEHYIYYLLYHDGTAADYGGTLADYGGTPAGYAAIKLSEDAVFLSKAYVYKEFRGKRIFKRFMEFLTEQYLVGGVSRIWLTVNKNNENSIAAYERAGFKIVDEMVTDIGDGFAMDDYKMELTR